MVDYIKEKYTNASPDPISLKQTEKLLEQMKSNSICRINDKGNGFFVKIPYKSILLTVLTLLLSQVQGPLHLNMEM